MSWDAVEFTQALVWWAVICEEVPPHPQPCLDSSCMTGGLTVVLQI